MGSYRSPRFKLKTTNINYKNMPHYWTIEDRDEFAVFASKHKEEIADHVDEHPELLGETEYLVCKYDSIQSIIPLDVVPLKQYMHELRRVRTDS